MVATVLGIAAAAAVSVAAGPEYLIAFGAVVLLLIVALSGHRVFARGKTAEGGAAAGDAGDSVPHSGMDSQTPLGDTTEHSDVSSARRH